MDGDHGGGGVGLKASRTRVKIVPDQQDDPAARTARSGCAPACDAARASRLSLFDPILAVHTSDVQPLPHQITAVYEGMLPRHPLRFLLADDPGAGKTIMAGLLIKELIVRGDLQRCC